MQEATNLLIWMDVVVSGCCDHLFGVRCDSSLIFKHFLQVVSIKSTVVEVLRIMKEAS